MTYCIGVKLKSGLLAMADTRITSDIGSHSAKKISFAENEAGMAFVMTSGLRSVRDKTIIYFEEAMEAEDRHLDKMHRVANLLGQQIKKVAEEDRKQLVKNHYQFNIHAIIGGQFRGDSVPRLFLLYPEGNWVEVTEESPFALIGNAKFGIPLLNRTLGYHTDWHQALKLMFLSFDATVRNASDVEYPLDVVYYPRDSYQMSERRYQREELERLSALYTEGIIRLVQGLPTDWAEPLAPDSEPEQSP